MIGNQIFVYSGKRDAFIERKRRFTDNLKKKELEKIQTIQTNTGSRTQYIIKGIFEIYILLT
jgi:formylmethanofuran dehydrogenase subunit C